MKKFLLPSLLLLGAAASASVSVTVEVGSCSGGELRETIRKAVAAKAPQDTLIFKLLADKYEFHPAEGESRELHISNHDQTNPKAVGILIENAANVILDGMGAELLFHGRMLPIALLNSTDCSLRDLSIDFPNPQISQVVVEKNDTTEGRVTYRPEPWVDWEIRNSALIVKGEGWEHTPKSAIAFEGDTRRVVYRSGDLPVGVRRLTLNPDSSITAPWRDSRLKPGTRLAMRTWERPAPAIFLDADTAATLRDVAIRYAEGMGVLAQNCVGVTLDSCSVALRGAGDPRYFTTQADATHFSGCSGKVSVTNGLFEGMMDDAINVHGTYLKVTEVTDSATLRARYMHHQSWGFPWGAPGDSVQLISSTTMDIAGQPCTITAISTSDNRDFQISLSSPLPAELLASLADGTGTPQSPFGIENLTRSPEVYFARNTVRHNRARGALFSTPRPTVCEENLFDHTSGAAILLCGDCNGWYETGACRDVTIRHNTFINALTTPYQFTEAVISIYPVIPDLEHQRQPFHSGVTITDNRFVTFGTPLLYAKSTAGLRFLRNTLETNADYPAYHSPTTLPVTLISCPSPEIALP